MDITAVWLACLADCREPTTTSGRTEHIPARLLLPRARANDSFMLQASSVLDGIQKMETLVTESRAAYVDAQRFLPSKASMMTDVERDQLDQVFTSFIVSCGSQIQVMQCSSSDGFRVERDNRLGCRSAHQKAVVTCLSERLQDLTEAFTTLKADRKKASRFRSLQSASAARTCTQVMSPTTSTSLTSRTFVRTKQEATAEENASRAGEQISGEQLRKMEQENQQLEQNFQSELTELRQVEARMVELSQLLGMFTGKLQEQQEHVDEIHEAAVGTTANVEKGNTELSRTVEINQRSGRSFVIAVVVLAVVLLVFDQIIP